MTEDRAYDVVLWGATGFTGRLVAEQLAERYDEGDLDWAIAGRDEGKLADVRADLVSVDPDWASLDLLTGDAFDRERLDAIAERTRVVCSTVGPYARYGSPLVAACVEAGTDYCDLTGEVQWMRRMIDEHHETAAERGVRIVHACGFDSIPSDLGTLFLQEYARDTYGAPCSTVDFSLHSGSGGFSGGTLSSMADMYEQREEEPDVKRILADPYALSPPGERDGPDGPPQRWPRRDGRTGAWTAPFVMATINEKVVRRSSALLGYPWGRSFRYREAISTGSGVRGALGAVAVAGGVGLFAGAMSVPRLRDLLEERVFPDPGEGPSRETRESGSFEVRLVGRGERPDTGREFTVEGVVRSDRDPGYGSTARMLSEAAVCLARGEPDTPLDGGVLTPASGIGTPLIDRLRDVGIEFNVGL